MMLRGYRRLPWLAAAALLAVLWLIGSGIWDAAPSGGDEDPLRVQQERVVIVLLSAGADRASMDRPWTPTRDAFFRIQKTADVYHACARGGRYCTVIVSGGDPDRQGISDAQLYRPWLISLGVDSRDVELETRSANTHENARYVSLILRDMRCDRVILVTSAYHMRRARLNFQGFGVSTQPAPAYADSAVASLIPRRRNFLVACHRLHEAMGIAQYWVFRWVGIY
ncbi:YdcF family protein [Caballeronia sp. RCC_10]|uniref:YdcF family protein n=1 Tax=Caballeronia sp. RCC_10 TaxID=3239227 RepID=UPI00352498C0